MFSGFVNRSIGLRLILLGALPLLGLLLVSFIELSGRFAQVREERFVAEVLDIAPVISEAVHQLQKERGMSSGFVGSKGVSFADGIAGQRQATDAAIARYLARIGEATGRIETDGFTRARDAAAKTLQDLSRVRADIDALRLESSDVGAYYTPVIGNLLDMVGGMPTLISAGDTLRPVLAYIALLQAKERAGLERATGAVGFGSGSFGEAVYRNFIRLGAMQEASLETFRRYASPQMLSAYETALSGAAAKEIDGLRQIAVSAPFGGDVSAVSGAKWFAVSTARIDLLKEVEDEVAGQIFVAASQRAADGQRAFLWQLGLVAGLVVVMAVIFAGVYRSIVPPLAELVGVMRRLAANDTGVEVTSVARRDEIGAMAGAVEIFRENAIERIELEHSLQEERLRERDRQSAIETMIAGFRSSVSSTLSTAGAKAGDMRSSAETLEEGASGAACDASAASHATQTASGNIQVVAAAAEELSASIREIAEQTSKASDLMASAAERAQLTNADVASLSQAAEQIGSVVNLIRDIAEQTNLLALNATIEAARAGEAGKGFAVVAAEVKNLAGQTAKATEDIAAQVTGIQASTRGAVGSIGEIAGVMANIRELTTTIAGAVEEQRAATQEIANSVIAASDGTDAVADNVTSVTSAIERTAQFAGNVSAVSSSLAEVTQQLAGEVETFLADIAVDLAARRAQVQAQMREAVVVTALGRRYRARVDEADVHQAAVSASARLELRQAVKLQLADGQVLAAIVAGGEGGRYTLRFEQPAPALVALVAA